MIATFLGLTANAWLAIVGGVYALATLLLVWATNRSSRRSVEAAREIATEQVNAAKKSVESQIAASAKGVADQITASAQTQGQQIAAMREAALIQARAASVSNNRQGWINALRDEVTGFLTDAGIISIVRDNMPINDERAREQRRINRALSAHIYKVRLLINPTEGESTELLEMLQEAYREGLTDVRQNIIVEHTQKILKTEWERVKSGE